MSDARSSMFVVVFLLLWQSPLAAEGIAAADNNNASTATPVPMGSLVGNTPQVAHGSNGTSLLADVDAIADRATSIIGMKRAIPTAEHVDVGVVLPHEFVRSGGDSASSVIEKFHERQQSMSKVRRPRLVRREQLTPPHQALHSQVVHSRHMKPEERLWPERVLPRGAIHYFRQRGWHSGAGGLLETAASKVVGGLKKTDGNLTQELRPPPKEYRDCPQTKVYQCTSIMPSHQHNCDEFYMSDDGEFVVCGVELQFSEAQNACVWTGRCMNNMVHETDKKKTPQMCLEGLLLENSACAERAISETDIPQYEGVLLQTKVLEGAG